MSAPASLEDPQAGQAKKRDQGEVVRVGRQPSGGDQRFELQQFLGQFGRPERSCGRRS
jgi:hypothetical protein